MSMLWRRTALAGATATVALLIYVRWRSRRTRRDMQTVLRDAEASVPYVDSSPIYGMLNRGYLHQTEHISVQYVLPESTPLESLFCRLVQKDVAKGCIDPSLLGTEACRDTALLRVGLDVGAWRELRVPCFMAHLVNPLGLCDPDAEDPAAPVWADGSWTGTLFWDSAAHVCEMLLSRRCWRERLHGSSCLELGCGLGIPGMVASLLGASPVLLTDRHEVAMLAEAGCRANGLDGARGVAFEWEEAAARALLAEHFAGEAPSFILACDCIFAPLFGESHLLLRMLSVLVGPATTVVLALERRPEDGAEDFFRLSSEAGFETRLLEQRKRVVCCEMWLQGARAPVGEEAP